MGKNTIVMSLSVKPEFHAHLKEVSNARDINNVSELCRSLVRDFLDIDTKAYEKLQYAADQRGVSIAELVEYLVDRFPLEDDTVKPIVLKIPVEVVQDKDALHHWLTQKVAALVNHLHPN